MSSRLNKSSKLHDNESVDNIKAVAWKNEDSKLYFIQIDSKEKIKTKLASIMKEWKLYAEGFNDKIPLSVFIYRREFSSKTAWLKWVKNFPYSLYEISSRGNKKLIKIGKGEI